MNDNDRLIRKYNSLHSHLKSSDAENLIQDPNVNVCWINPKAKPEKKNKNFYTYTERDFTDLTKKLNEIYEREEHLKNLGYNLDGIKCFNRNVSMDISKSSTELEGIFEDFDLDLMDLRLKFKGKFAADPKGKFSRHSYFKQLRAHQETMLELNDSIVISGKNQQHLISLETAMHYMAFKYMYRCAKHDRMKDVTPEEFYETLHNASCLLSGLEINRFRTIPVYLKKAGYYDNPNWTPSRVDRINDEINALTNSLYFDKDIINLHPLIKSALFHVEFVRIHPFLDGNGRTARLMSNYILISEEVPAISITSNDLYKYHDAISTAVETHNLDKMIDLFYNSMLRAIDGIDKCLTYIENKKNVVKQEKTL